MMLSDTLIGAIVRTHGALAPLGVPTALLGGVAVSMWGPLRATRDADLILSIAIAKIDEVIETLRRHGIRSRHTPPRKVHFDGVDLIQFDCAISGSHETVRIDLQFARSEYHRQLLDRRVRRKLPDTETEVDVVSCEDLILLKLLAGRVVDVADAASLLRYNENELDVDYLIRWSRPLKLVRKLKVSWEEAFPGRALPQLSRRGEDDCDL
jgi:hypothetical protein